MRYTILHFITVLAVLFLFLSVSLGQGPGYGLAGYPDPRNYPGNLQNGPYGLCLTNHLPCYADSNCCSNNCKSYICAEKPNPPTCQPTGAWCFKDDMCCSGSCKLFMWCGPKVTPERACLLEHFICFTDSACCSYKCDGFRCTAPTNFLARELHAPENLGH